MTNLQIHTRWLQIAKTFPTFNQAHTEYEIPSTYSIHVASIDSPHRQLVRLPQARIPWHLILPPLPPPPPQKKGKNCPTFTWTKFSTTHSPRRGRIPAPVSRRDPALAIFIAGWKSYRTSVRLGISRTQSHTLYTTLTRAHHRLSVPGLGFPNQGCRLAFISLAGI